MPVLEKNFDERRREIRKILNTSMIRDQDELQRRLARKGYRVTQSSVSRDLQGLNVIKIDGRYVLAEGGMPAAAPAPTFSAPPAALADAAWITALTPAGNNLLVVHVPAARAGTLAVTIDQYQWPEVVGSIAGDDTLFIATRNRTDLLRVKQRLETARNESRDKGN